MIQIREHPFQNTTRVFHNDSPEQSLWKGHRDFSKIIAANMHIYFDINSGQKYTIQLLATNCIVQGTIHIILQIDLTIIKRHK